MAKIGSEAGPRLIAAYYPLLLAGVLLFASLDGILVKGRLFQLAGWFALLSAFPLVLLNPARPLFPVHLIAGELEKLHAPAALTQRYDQVYGVYAFRFEGFHALQNDLPASERVVGFIQDGNNPEASLWRPFGSREIVEVKPEWSREELERRGIYFIVIGQEALDDDYHTTIDALMRQWSAKLAARQDLTLLAQRGPETWYVLSL
jgi:hypothetical protein